MYKWKLGSLIFYDDFGSWIKWEKYGICIGNGKKLLGCN